MRFTTCYLDHFLILYSINFLRSCNSFTGLFWDTKLPTFCASPSVNDSFLGQDHCVKASTTYLYDFLVFEELHRRRNMPVFLVVKSSKHGRTPRIKLRHSGERHTMFVASNNLCYVLDVAIKYWSPDDCWHVVMSKSQLTRLVVPPHIELSVLVNSQCVRVATTDFFDELVFQRHEQPWVENFQALNRAHLFAGNKIV